MKDMKVLYKKEKGVSPVIATILMVAITVVLASAVYLMVSGYIGSSPSKPVAIGVVPTNTATATQFLISSGSIAISSSTPLLITLNQLSPGETTPVTIKITSATSGPISDITSSPSGVTVNLYNPGSSSTVLGAGSTITISYNNGPLPSGAIVTFTYNGNVIYSYTVP
jgi:flagellin-like protein